MCIIGSMIEKHSNAKMQVWQRGFKYTLTNGYTLSCAFGYGNYCDNRHDRVADLGNKDGHAIESSNFEVAVFEPNGNMVDLIRTEPDEDGFSHTDQVLGFVPASALWKLLYVLRFWPRRDEFKNEPETFEEKLRIRCKQFCGIVKLTQDEADKETANV